MLRTFDASSMIYAWDNYPRDQFPPLWRWIAARIRDESFGMSQVAFEEVDRRSPDCAEWLRDQDIRRLAVTNEIAQEALRIKNLLNIEGDNYKPKGVGENDLLIIATAKIEELGLVSNEGRQNQFPTVAANAKIPAVCDLESVEVDCIDFITLIKRSGEIFESPGR